jgi:beta-lactamase regulating signal transducer with metallopeptidase domain
MNMVCGLIDGPPAARVLDWLLQSMLFGTLLAGITWLVTATLRRRIPPRVDALLWTLVLVKFLVPMGPPWSQSMASWWQRAPTAGLPAAIFADVHRAPVTAGTTAAAARPAAPASLDVPKEPTSPNHPTGTAAHAGSVESVDPGLSAPRWVTLVAAFYVASVALLLTFRVRAYVAFRLRCGALTGADDATSDLVTRVCRRLGARCAPSTRVSDEPAAPFIVGAIRPLLVLPRRLLVRPDELETVIVHEVAHLRRGDLLIRSLEWIAGTLFFFWPVLGWVNRRIDAAREQACDEWALSRGKLTPGAYARCLLDAAWAMSHPRNAFRPASMAGTPSMIERRIDVILESPKTRPVRRRWGLVTLVALPAWSAFALTGPAEVRGIDRMDTETGVQQRAAELYQRIAEHEAADFDGDGVLSYTERDAYLVALAMQSADAFVEAFPYADRNHSEHLDLLEALDVIKGVTLIAYADRRANATSEQSLVLEFCHKALDAQQWLLDHVTVEPCVGELDNAWSVVRRMESPSGSFSARMFNHGGPVIGTRKPCWVGERSKFQELENQIALIETRLAETTDGAMIAKLQGMLGKLEGILTELQEADADEADRSPR